MIAFLRVLAGLGIFLFGIGLPLLPVIVNANRRRYAREGKRAMKPRTWIVAGLVLAIACVVFLVALSGAVYVPATSNAVIENTLTGELFVLGPGTRIWPFEPRLTPLVTRVTLYDLRDQVIEIGGQPVKEFGIEASSSSPGRPIVYFYARGWAKVNPDKLIELHRRRGTDWADSWVEKVWVTALKNVQRVTAYDYVGTEPLEFTQRVESGLQAELVDVDSEPIIFVSQLAIADYDYADEVNSYLDQVAQLEFTRQEEVNRESIVLQQQTNKQIEADTDYNVKKRAAEAYQIEIETRAAGDATAKKLAADAEAYAIEQRYTAEAEGVMLLQQALARSPEAYLDYLRARQWDGRLPTWWMPGSEETPLPVPFIEAAPPE
jgi:hypothetical protein